MRTGTILVASASAALLAATLVLGAERAKAPEGVSLMQTFSEWKYPGAGFGGASMSDGGFLGVSSVKCQAKQTTPDTFEKVVEYYAQQLGSPKTQDAKSPTPGSLDKSVGTMADSEGRAVSVQVFAVNKAKSATTLVISRAKDEKETHIDWLHYIRHDVKP